MAISLKSKESIMKHTYITNLVLNLSMNQTHFFCFVFFYASDIIKFLSPKFVSNTTIGFLTISGDKKLVNLLKFTKTISSIDELRKQIGKKRLD